VTQTDAVAAELGRHYVAGHLEADELDERLGRLNAAPESAVDLLEDLPGLEPAVPAPVASRKAGGAAATARATALIRTGSPPPSASSTRPPTA
jgi:hypothetical protein